MVKTGAPMMEWGRCKPIWIEVQDIHWVEQFVWALRPNIQVWKVKPPRLSLPISWNDTITYSQRENQNGNEKLLTPKPPRLRRSRLCRFKEKVQCVCVLHFHSRTRRFLDARREKEKRLSKTKHKLTGFKASNPNMYALSLKSLPFFLFNFCLFFFWIVSILVRLLLCGIGLAAFLFYDVLALTRSWIRECDLWWFSEVEREKWTIERTDMQRICTRVMMNEFLNGESWIVDWIWEMKKKCLWKNEIVKQKIAGKFIYRCLIC